MPTPASTSLDERVHDHREALTALMTDDARCDDILSGANGAIDLTGNGDSTGTGVSIPVSVTGVTDGAVIGNLDTVNTEDLTDPGIAQS